MQIKLKRLQARMAAYQAAVVTARQAGMTWTEIGERLGMPGEAARKAFVRAQAAMQSGKLIPMEQAPLPDPPDLPPTPTIAGKSEATKTGAGQGQSTKEFLASLEQIGGKK